MTHRLEQCRPQRVPPTVAFYAGADRWTRCYIHRKNLRYAETVAGYAVKGAPLQDTPVVPSVLIFGGRCQTREPFGQKNRPENQNAADSSKQPKRFIQVRYRQGGR